MSLALIRKILQERVQGEYDEPALSSQSKAAVNATNAANEADDWKLHQKAGALHFEALKHSKQKDKEYHSKMIKYHLDRMNEYE